MVLSDNERRRFEQITSELLNDEDIIRLDKKSRSKATRAKAKSARRRRSLVEWAEQRFYNRMRRDHGEGFT